MQINFILQKYNVMNQKCMNLFSKSDFFCEMRDGHNFGEIGPRTKYVLYVHDFVTLWG